MQVKAKIRQSFGSACHSYDSVAALQRAVGYRLLEQVGTINRQDMVMDLGCGTGFMGQALRAQGRVVSGQLLAVDIAMPMLYLARNKLQPECSPAFVCGDMEALPCAMGSIDVLISNLALQWCQDTSRAFSEIYRVLKPGGRVVLTTFGTKTLQELKQAWQTVDTYSHVNDFYSSENLQSMMVASGFDEVDGVAECHVNRYATVLELMKELKMLGAHTVKMGRHKQFTTRSVMQRMINAYCQQANEGAVLATFEVVSLSASRKK